MTNFRLPRILIIAALAVALLAAAATASDTDDHNHSDDVAADRDEKDEHFRKCICWNNVTQDFCNSDAGDDDGDWTNSYDCESWKWKAVWWVVPLVILAIFYVLFPVFLFLGRLLCNCCGGRLPSDGGCCPSDHAIKTFPGYTRCTVIFNKVAYTCLFAGYIALGVLAIVATARWHNAAEDAISSVVDTSTRMLTDLQVTESSLRALTEAPAFTTTAVVATVSAAYSEFQERHERILQIEDEGDTDGNSRPSNFAYNAVAFPMLFLLIGFFCMLFSVTGAPITILSGLTSWVTALLVLAATAFLVFSVVTQVLCRTWDDTALPVVVGSIQSVSGCDSPVLTAAINETAIAFDNYVRNATSSVCVDIATLCAAGFSCNLSPCGTSATSVADVKYVMPDVTRFSAFVIDNSFGNNTLHDCVSDCTNTTSAAAVRVLNFEVEHSASITRLVEQIFPQTFECTYVRKAMADSIKPQLCKSGGLADRTSVLATFLGSLTAVATAALYFYVRGGKRWAQQIPEQVVDFGEDATCPCACHYPTDASYAGDQRPVCHCRCAQQPFGDVEMVGGMPAAVPMPAAPHAEQPADLPVQHIQVQQGVVVGSVVHEDVRPEFDDDREEGDANPNGSVCLVDCAAANPTKSKQ